MKSARFARVADARSRAPQTARDVFCQRRSSTARDTFRARAKRLRGPESAPVRRPENARRRAGPRRADVRRRAWLHARRTSVHGRAKCSARAAQSRTKPHARARSFLARRCLIKSTSYSQCIDSSRKISRDCFLSDVFLDVHARTKDHGDARDRSSPAPKAAPRMPRQWRDRGESICRLSGAQSASEVFENGFWCTAGLAMTTMWR